MKETKAQIKVAIDLDDTISNFVEIWIDKYNEIYSDNLMKESITDWDVGKFTKRGSKIYELLNNSDIYLNASIKYGAKDTIEWMQCNGFDPYIVTATYNYRACAPKTLWIKRELPKFDISKVIFCNNKNMISADILIDDKYDNVKNFHGVGYLFGDDNGWNKKFKYEPRLPNWEYVYTMMKMIIDNDLLKGRK
jgi:5'(3')-deoxyribonucleotidase